MAAATGRAISTAISTSVASKAPGRRAPRATAPNTPTRETRGTRSMARHPSARRHSRDGSARSLVSTSSRRSGSIRVTIRAQQGAVEPQETTLACPRRVPEQVDALGRIAIRVAQGNADGVEVHQPGQAVHEDVEDLVKRVAGTAELGDDVEHLNVDGAPMERPDALEGGPQLARKAPRQEPAGDRPRGPGQGNLAHAPPTPERHPQKRPGTSLLKGLESSSGNAAWSGRWSAGDPAARLPPPDWLRAPGRRPPPGAPAGAGTSEAPRGRPRSAPGGAARARAPPRTGPRR